MKHTVKFKAALLVAPQVIEQSELPRAWRDNASLYDALEKRGWFWDAESSKWADYQKSTSMFAGDDGLPTGEFRLRLMAHPGDMDRLIELVSETLDTYAVIITEISNQYPNRRGPGVRIYMSCKLPTSPKKGKTHAN
jgi:hypothetical protein